MTFRLRFWFIGAIFLSCGLINAQDEPEIPALTDGETVTITLEGEITPTLLTYEGQAGEVITLIARNVSEGEAVDLVMEILHPDGRRLAFNDDHLTEVEDIDLAQTDSAFVNLILPTDGNYLIRVNSYGGIFTGTAEITLNVVDLFDVEVISDEPDLLVLHATLPPYQTFTYPLEISAGETVEITARDLSSTLDPLLRLVDASGEVLAQNDDHTTFDLTLNVYDSRLIFSADEDASFTVEVTDFLGKSGQLEFMIRRS